MRSRGRLEMGIDVLDDVRITIACGGDDCLDRHEARGYEVDRLKQLFCPEPILSGVADNVLAFDPVQQLIRNHRCTRCYIEVCAIDLMNLRCLGRSGIRIPISLWPDE